MSSTVTGSVVNNTLTRWQMCICVLSRPRTENILLKQISDAFLSALFSVTCAKVGVVMFPRCKGVSCQTQNQPLSETFPFSNQPCSDKGGDLAPCAWINLARW